MKKKSIIILGSICLLVLLLVFLPIIWYKTSISPKKDDTVITVEIPIGSTISDIAHILKTNGIIKNELAFRIYSKLNKVSGLQAGTYSIKPSTEINDLIEYLKQGKVYKNTDFNITFIEGKNMRYIAKTIAENTNNTEEDVYNLLNDEQYITDLINKYWFLTDVIKNKNIYYPLEGYLFPDTYSFDSHDIKVQDVFEKMLDQMDVILTKYKDKIEEKEYNVHEILTLASMCELEAMHKEDRAEIAGLFYNRLKANMALGSDVTTYYAVKVDMGERDLYQSELDLDNPYNTRNANMAGMLPVSPICNISESSIIAAIEPNTTNSYYFVSDKNGKLYFSKSYSEHVNIINKLKNSDNWFTH